MLITYTTKNYKETQKLGEEFARFLSSPRSAFVATLAKEAKRGSSDGAIVIGLLGNLGGGKTTFLQGFAKGLKIKQKILSPTFVILKHYKNFYHIDCYRLKNEKDILELNFLEIIKNPENIVAVEWPEKIKKVLPKNTIYIDFKFIDENKREISFKM